MVDKQEMPEKGKEKLAKAEKAFKKTIEEGAEVYRDLAKRGGHGMEKMQWEIKEATQVAREQMTVFENIGKFNEGRDGKDITFEVLIEELGVGTKILERLLDSVDKARTHLEAK